MAVLYITEFSDILSTGKPVQMSMQPPNAEQTVAIAAGSAQSSAFKNNTNILRLHTDAICSVEFGTNPTASATTARMAANTTEYFAVPMGQAYKVAVITNT